MLAHFVMMYQERRTIVLTIGNYVKAKNAGRSI